MDSRTLAGIIFWDITVVSSVGPNFGTLRKGKHALWLPGTVLSFIQQSGPILEQKLM